MTNMHLRFTFLLASLLGLVTIGRNFAQIQDKNHYPDPAYWHYLHLKNHDSVITCMRYYFRSEDTLYFRAHPSLQVIKMAAADFQMIGFSTGKDYHFAEKGQKMSTRLFYSEKLDRYYDYYLHAPAVHIEPIIKETAPEEPVLAVQKEIPVENGLLSWNQPGTYAPSTTGLALPALIYTKSGSRYELLRYCFLSNGAIYFTLLDREGVFYIPLTEIVKAEGIFDLGNDLDLAHRSKYRKNTRRMVGFSFIVYPVLIVTVPTAIFRTIRHKRYREAKMLG
jgi:hypothetical protein